MKNSKVFFIALTAMALLPMMACGRVHIESSERYVTKPVTQKLGSFDKISVDGSVDVEFTVGNSRSMEIYGADNAIQYVDLSVRNNTLYVSMSNDVQIYGKSRLTVLVTAPTLTEVSISGSGDVEVLGRCNTLTDVSISGSGDIDVRNLKVDSFTASVTGSGDIELNNLTAKNASLRVSGSGDIEVRGTADKAAITINGSGDVDAEHFIVRELDAVVSGSGDIECYAEELLNATVSGSGEISYRGNPAKINRSGRESSIHRDY